MITALFLTILLQTSVTGTAATTKSFDLNDVQPSSSQEFEPLPIILVRAQRHSLAYAFNSSISTLTDSELRTEAPRHPNEIFDRTPGTWVSNA